MEIVNFIEWVHWSVCLHPVDPKIEVREIEREKWNRILLFYHSFGHLSWVFIQHVAASVSHSMWVNKINVNEKLTNRWATNANLIPSINLSNDPDFYSSIFSCLVRCPCVVFLSFNSHQVKCKQTADRPIGQWVRASRLSVVPISTSSSFVWLHGWICGDSCIFKYFPYESRPMHETRDLVAVVSTLFFSFTLFFSLFLFVIWFRRSNAHLNKYMYVFRRGGTNLAHSLART